MRACSAASSSSARTCRKGAREAELFSALVGGNRGVGPSSANSRKPRRHLPAHTTTARPLPTSPAHLLLLRQRQALCQALQAVHGCLLLLLGGRQLAAHCSGRGEGAGKLLSNST